GVVDDFQPVSRLHLGYPAGQGAALSGLARRPSRVVPRTVLDARLRDAAAAAGAVVCQRTVRRAQVRPDGVVLDGAIRARTVVAADGAESVLRRSTGLPRADDRHLAVAIRGYAPVRPDLAEEQRIVLARGDRAAYAWSFPIGDGRANVGYGEVLGGRPRTRAHLLERLDNLLPGVAEDGTAWRGHHLPLSPGRPRQPDGRILLAGDALSLVNPLTGEGIYYAVLSGACAGTAAVSGAADPGRAYRTALDRQLRRHLRHTTAAARLARSPRLVDAVLRAGDRDDAVFDALTDLGLGRGLLTGRVLRATGRSFLLTSPSGARAAPGPG
ncbi:MAG TPA: NAD(P)/FAD-dependent oxidoreductase, partial [Jiangellales bacterium]|nr:NAD(P)/FAD-dependent oxidoreductase [Jiangellales bacterium]